MSRFFALLFSHFTLLSVCFHFSYGQNNQLFSNPILAGFYPDPSICKVEDDYYLVTSTFSFFPGLPIFHSKDLVNWKLIGHVLDRPEQLSLDSQGVSRGLFAPTIRYNNSLFYVTCTLVDVGGNFVVTSKLVEGPWSNLIWLPEINGIDPSFFFDDDGKSYILYNSDAPDNKPLYQGHRTIRMVEFDIEKMKVTSEPKILINGGVDITKKPIWIEGPHIYKVNGTYYLTAAEGGTAEDHSQSIFKSDKIDGPYVPYDKNPILTQRDLDPNRKNPVTCTGHADFVQTDIGDWWAVFLGCRPFVGDNYNTGRETFLAPVKWIDGWPVINPDFKEVQFHYLLPIESSNEKVDIPYSSNFTLKDEFDKADLHPSWIFLRTPHEKWYNLNSRPGYLSIKLRPETCSGKMNPSFIARRQQHSEGTAIISLEFNPNAENEKAGLIVFLNETHYYFLCKSMLDGAPVIQLFKSTDNTTSKNEMELIAFSKIDEPGIEKRLNLKIEADKNIYSFYYSYEVADWVLLKENLDAAFLSVRIPRDFAGCVYAMYATSLGKPSNNIASFDWFEYTGNDEVYK
jgi:xylan 1,4-beta-xylosidase